VSQGGHEEDRDDQEESPAESSADPDRSGHGHTNRALIVRRRTRHPTR
jgi:hypothetical protein